MLSCSLVFVRPSVTYCLWKLLFSLWRLFHGRVVVITQRPYFQRVFLLVTRVIGRQGEDTLLLEKRVLQLFNPWGYWAGTYLQPLPLGMFGYLEQKLLGGRLWKSLFFLKSNFYVSENFKFHCDPFSNKKDVSQRSSYRQLGPVRNGIFYFGIFFNETLHIRRWA
jgi:hypothetical protein